MSSTLSRPPTKKHRSNVSSSLLHPLLPFPLDQTRNSPMIKTRGMTRPSTRLGHPHHTTNQTAAGTFTALARHRRSRRCGSLPKKRSLILKSIPSCQTQTLVPSSTPRSRMQARLAGLLKSSTKDSATRSWVQFHHVSICAQRPCGRLMSVN